MVLVNGGFLDCTDIKKFLQILLWKRQKKKIGKSNLKKSGERSRAILALLLSIDGLFLSLPNYQILDFSPWRGLTF